MASEKLSNLVNLAGAQVPTDLAYVVDVSAGTAGSKRSTLNDLFSEITKNITDLSVQFINNAAASTVSDASKGKLAYDQTAASAVGSFRVSENAGIYQNLIKGPLSGGNLTANLLPFAQNGASVANTALAQTGSSGSRILTFVPTSPGTSLSSYNGGPLTLVNEALAGASIGLIGMQNEIRIVTYGLVSTFAAPIAVADNQILGLLSVRGQYGTTVGNFNTAGYIQIRATQAWAVGSSGASMSFSTLANGQAVGNHIERMIINQTGAVHVAPNSGGTGKSTTGTDVVFMVGGTVAAGSRTDDNDTASFFGTVQNAGKNVVIQQQNEQTGALLELQYQNGTAGFGLYPTASVSGIYEDWLGTTNPPAVSAAGHARLYVSSAGQFLASQNGGAYSAFFPVSGGGVTGAVTITASSANALAVGPNGTTNPTLNVITNVASAATGLSITGNAAGAGLTLAVTSSGANEGITLIPKGATAQIAFLSNGTTTSFADGQIWIRSQTGELVFGTGADVRIARHAAGVLRIQDQNGTGSGSLIIGPSTASIGTSGVAVFAVGGSTAPTTSPADQWQAYSIDWNGGGTAAPHFRTEDGTIWRLGGTALSTSANAIANLGTAAESFIQLFLDQTLTATGTTGNQTINKSAGSVNFAAAATTLTVTCNKCTANSVVICTVLTNDAAATIKNVVPAAGSFVITLGAAATAETRVGFWVLNQ